MSEDLTKLAKYGSTGIAIGLIILVGYIVQMFSVVLNETITDNTRAINDLRISVEKLNYNLDRVDISKLLEQPVVLSK